jgi:hypothetical protein
MNENQLTKEEREYIISFCQRTIDADKMGIEDDKNDEEAGRDDINLLEPEDIDELERNIETCESIIKKLEAFAR